MRTSQPGDFRRRGMWLVMGFAAMAAAVFGRLVQVQVLQGPQYAAQAAAQHTTDITLHGTRGLILDRNGRVLVSNRTVYDVFADPALVETSQRVTVARQVAPILGISVAAVERALEQPNQFDYLEKGVSQTVNNRLAALNIAGIGTIPTQQRVYEPSPVPGISFASNLLGFVDADAQGQYGVEQFYNSILSGSTGHESALVDLQGNPIVLSNDTMVPAHDGDNLELGLDTQAQYWAEIALAHGVQVAQAQSGTLMIMDTKTGAIRAWAQYPSYDANNYGSGDLADFRDLAVTQPYEPGSVMKVVTFAGGLQSHAITPQTVIDERQTVVDGSLIHDWDGVSHGRVTMQRVLDLSLNNGAMAVERMEGPSTFYANMLGFGIGAPTGLDLAGEVNQPLAPQQQWKDINYATASFGQGVVVTPVEMLAAVNAIANGGVWVQPHAVDSVIDPSTGKSTQFQPRTRRVMSADAAHTLAHMMVGVVDDPGAEGFEARIPAYEGQVAGKTGTASVAVNGVYG
ncbi:MAG TPA: penicillin-binding protein 2, partial [Dehalococcoidia bacterium]|nr:penicillin-binding protein 2 [Dehalococcoidia bacterium]